MDVGHHLGSFLSCQVAKLTGGAHDNDAGNAIILQELSVLGLGLEIDCFEVFFEERGDGCVDSSLDHYG